MKHAQSASRFLVMTWLLLGVFVVPVRASSGVVPDVTGTWALMVTDTVDNCIWKGPMLLTQSGMDFTGSCMLDLVSGDKCSSMINGTIMGSIGGSGSGFTIDFGLASGAFGMVTFSGIVSVDGQSASGMWTTNDNASGTWSADKQPAQVAPAMSAVALMTLMALLTVVGVLYARRRTLRERPAATG